MIFDLHIHTESEMCTTGSTIDDILSSVNSFMKIHFDYTTKKSKCCCHDLWDHDLWDHGMVLPTGKDCKELMGSTHIKKALENGKNDLYTIFNGVIAKLINCSMYHKYLSRKDVRMSKFI